MNCRQSTNPFKLKSFSFRFLLFICHSCNQSFLVSLYCVSYSYNQQLHYKLQVQLNVIFADRSYCVTAGTFSLFPPYISIDGNFFFHSLFPPLWSLNIKFSIRYYFQDAMHCLTWSISISKDECMQVCYRCQKFGKIWSRYIRRSGLVPNYMSLHWIIKDCLLLANESLNLNWNSYI